MLAKSVFLKNFRNYKSQSFIFSDSITLFVGKNGVGKTNILEALYVLTHGKSWRTRYDFELINYNYGSANIKGFITKKDKESELFIGIQKGSGNRSKKVFKKNGSSKNLGSFTQSLKSVLFSPTDLEIILGSPASRRRFLDEVLSQISVDYSKNIRELKKVVTSRNRILKRLNEGFGTYDEIIYWNKLHIKISKNIHRYRSGLISYINSFLDKNYQDISNSKGSAVLEYKHSKSTNQRFEKYKDAEISSKRTLIGAQKDDFEIIFTKHGKGLASKYYASRGEQRTLVFILKLAALKHIEERLDERVVLLLDDIYSELDNTHRNAISTYFKHNQVIITTAEKLLIPKEYLNSSEVVVLD